MICSMLTSSRFNGIAMKFQHSVKRRKFSYAFLYVDINTHKNIDFYHDLKLRTNSFFCEKITIHSHTTLLKTPFLKRILTPKISQIFYGV